LRTKEKHLDRLRFFFAWCVDRKEIADNPIAKLHLTTKEQDNTPSRREFTEPELTRVFDPEAFERFQKPHQYWAPLLSLYSGMRVNEIAQLYVDDVDCVNGIWGVHVAARHPGQTLKNLSSWRFVPLHSKVLELGLLAYRERVAAHRFSHLFPGLSWGVNGPGDGVSDWFGRYLDRVGLSDRALSFHSFRHTVATFLDRSEVLESRIAELTGHSRGQSVLRRVYIKAATLPTRKADVEHLVFPFVDRLRPMAPNRFEGYLRATKAKAARKGRSQREALR
jgi:integrase